MRTVVSFESFGDITVFKLEDAPSDVEGLGVNAVADVTPPEGADPVARGQAMMQRLAGHPPVKAGLDLALSRPPDAEPLPLYFHMLASAADELPWEQLYAAPHGFCALDRRWPVARIARRRRRITDRAFDGRLHLVAVLSAASRSGVPQLQSLLSAAGSEDAAAVGLKLHVISGEEAVLQEAANSGLPNVTSETMAGDSVGLCKQIAAARPTLVHLLCHGGAVAGVRTLAFANLADFDAGEETGSVRVKAADLVTAVTASDPWLVLLNACGTADATDGPALAHDLAYFGVPAVIGMRRLVDLGDANKFSAALYAEVLGVVRKALDPDGPPGVRTLDWAAALTVPRMALSGPDPAAIDSWSDPVLYVQEDDLRVFRASAQMSASDYTALRGQLDVWQAYQQTLDPARTPPEALAEVAAKIAELEAAIARAAT